MNISIILDYFEHFLYYQSIDSSNNYSFLSARHRFKDRNQKIHFCGSVNIEDADNKKNKNQGYYFLPALKLNSIPKGVDTNRLSNHYELFFRRIFKKKNTEVLITSGTTAFERCGLQIAKEMGIKTLCVWEGFFRPFTISVDPNGMNAESEFYSLNLSQIKNYSVSNDSRLFLQKYREHLNSNIISHSLKKIHAGRFNLFKQARKRFAERNDIERIRLKFSKLFYARYKYYLEKRHYTQIHQIDKPFLFFPLQTHTDTNFVINSSISNIDKFLTSIIAIFLQKRFSKDLMLIIKEHPLDIFRKYYPKVVDKNVKWLDPIISNISIIKDPLCVGVLTINSTTGIESLLLNKPVITCGQSIYDKDELVIRNNSLNSLGDDIEKLMFYKVDRDLVDKFSCYLFEKYQLEGNLDEKPTFSEIYSIMNLVN